MAEFVNSIGQIRGRYGNVIGYVGANGKNYCKGTALLRKSGGESEKRRSVAFGTVVARKGWMMNVIRVGFPGSDGYPKGFRGFTSANVPGAVAVEAINPEKEVSPRKKAPREFRGCIDYGKLRVAAGALAVPSVGVNVDAGNREIVFTHRGASLESVDCFLDDKVYGAFLFEPECVCRVMELGTRGETFEKSMGIPEDVDPDRLVVYVFATNANGRRASDSVCLHGGM
ncbi:MULTISPECIES: hypothetical protein [Butyricimonas]|uniref:hypothetical protein n=1 Tax=Butyricimonas TaxID=574697 RepID=UPI0007FB1F1E|nr:MULTISPECIES: hypothetical protein [Butyricimonas]